VGGFILLRDLIRSLAGNQKNSLQPLLFHIMCHRLHSRLPMSYAEYGDGTNLICFGPIPVVTAAVLMNSQL